MRTAKILKARGLISPVPMTPGRFLSDPIGMLPGGAEPCLATPAKNSTLRFARSSTCIRQVCDRFDRRTVCSSFTPIVCFGMEFRRRSAPQVSDLIDTEGIARARLFTVYTISVVLALPQLIPPEPLFEV